MRENPKTLHRVYNLTFASVYPLYVTKVEKKWRSKEELNTVIFWLTGYYEEKLEKQINQNVSFEIFFAESPAMNPLAQKITWTICGVRIEEIQDPVYKNIRYLDKLVDELAKGRNLEKILRK